MFRAMFQPSKLVQDLTNRPKPVDDGECKGNHPQINGRTIQVSELYILIYPDHSVQRCRNNGSKNPGLA